MDAIRTLAEDGCVTDLIRQFRGVRQRLTGNEEKSIGTQGPGSY